jgi:hypothetical protein
LGALVSSAVALAIHALGQNPQANLQELAVALPLWLGVALSTWQADPKSVREPRARTAQMQENL